MSDHPQNVRNAMPSETTPISVRDSGTGVVVPNVGDTANQAIRVNVIAGGGGGGNVNLTGINGVAPSVGNGTTDPGTLRVTLSSDSTGQVKLAAGVAVIGSLAANQSVNVAQVAGTATSVNNGTTNAGTQRVTIASDSTGQVKLAAGANAIGTVGVTSVVPLTGSANLGKQAGGLFNAGDVGVFALAVDVGTGNYTNLAITNGALATTPYYGGSPASVNNGTTDATTQRVTISSDSTGQVKLAAGVAVIGSLAANQSVNVAQVAGTATSVNNGTTDAGTQRVTLSSDSTGQVKLAAGVAVIGSLAANQSVNQAQVAGTATSVNNGTTDAGTQRVTLSSDSTGQVALAAGAQAIGSVAVTSVVPGTGPTNLGKAEDLPHASGDTGVEMLGVRNELAATFNDNEQDYTPMAMSRQGFVYTQDNVNAPSTAVLRAQDQRDLAIYVAQMIALLGSGTDTYAENFARGFELR